MHRRKLTVPQLAQQWGVAAKKVRAFISTGELRAMNLASDRNGRARYAIDEDDVAAFERGRQVVPTPATNGRQLRRRAAEVKQFV